MDRWDFWCRVILRRGKRSFNGLMWMHGSYLVIRHWRRPPPFLQIWGPFFRLSREERKSYLDEADRFYADPEGFIKGIPELPQRLVFFDSLTPRLEGIRGRYLEVSPHHLTHRLLTSSARDSLIRGFMMIGVGKGMSLFGVCRRDCRVGCILIPIIRMHCIRRI